MILIIANSIAFNFGALNFNAFNFKPYNFGAQDYATDRICLTNMRGEERVLRFEFIWNGFLTANGNN